MYSNPTGLFNTSLPEKMMRTKNYTFVSYKQFKELKEKINNPNVDNQEQSTEPSVISDASATNATESEDITREWSTNHV